MVLIVFSVSKSAVSSLAPLFLVVCVSRQSEIPNRMFFPGTAWFSRIATLRELWGLLFRSFLVFSCLWGSRWRCAFRVRQEGTKEESYSQKIAEITKTIPSIGQGLNRTFFFKEELRRAGHPERRQRSRPLRHWRIRLGEKLRDRLRSEDARSQLAMGVYGVSSLVPFT